MNDSLMTVTEAAQTLAMSKKAVETMVAGDELRAVNSVGAPVRVLRADVVAMRKGRDAARAPRRRRRAG